MFVLVVECENCSFQSTADTKAAAIREDAVRISNGIGHGLRRRVFHPKNQTNCSCPIEALHASICINSEEK